MYIRLECSWWNHPLARSKFTVISQKEIKTIKDIRKVKLFYDPELSDPEEEPELETAPGAPDTAVGVPTQEDREQEEEDIQKEQVQACEEHTAELQKTSYLYQRYCQLTPNWAPSPQRAGNLIPDKSMDYSQVNCLFSVQFALS